MLRLQCRIDFQHFNIKMNGLPGQRMVEINGNGVAVNFADHAGISPPSIAVKA